LLEDAIAPIFGKEQELPAPEPGVAGAWVVPIAVPAETQHNHQVSAQLSPSTRFIITILIMQNLHNIKIPMLW